MTGKKSSKRSTFYSKGTNATLDQFFTLKNKNSENNTTTNTKNENGTKNIPSVSSDISKQQQQKKPPLSSKSLSDNNKQTASTEIKKQRRPLADIGGKATQTLTLMPTIKPAKPSFTVLRDDDIEQGVTESNRQQQRQIGTSLLPSHLSTNDTNPTKQSQHTDKNTTTKQQANDDTDDDTQDSQASFGSTESFFDDDDNDDAIEFRVDALDSDDEDDDNDGTTSSFFDDEDEAPFLTKTYRRTHLPAARTPSIPNKRSLDNNDEIEKRNKVIKNSHEDDSTKASQSSTEETDDQIISNNSSNLSEFSISNSLTIPLDIKDNYHSSSDEENDDADPSLSPSATAASPVASPTSQQPVSESPMPQLQPSQSSRTSQLSTLPMSLPMDEAVDLHVAYPVPRGKEVIDKFGH